MSKTDWTHFQAEIGVFAGHHPYIRSYNFESEVQHACAHAELL